MRGRMNNRRTMHVCANNHIKYHQPHVPGLPNTGAIHSIFLNATAISYIMSTRNENSYGNYLLGYAYEEI